MNAQIALENVYRDKWPHLVERLAPIAAKRKLSMPHLIDLNANGYSDASVRLMVVGQQTDGWYDQIPWDGATAETVKELVGGYDTFNLEPNTSGLRSGQHRTNFVGS